jgi:hypothetical protein
LASVGEAYPAIESNVRRVVREEYYVEVEVIAKKARG